MTIITSGIQSNSSVHETAPPAVKEIAYFMDYRTDDLTINVLKITLLFNDTDFDTRSAPNRFKIRLVPESGEEITTIVDTNFEIPLDKIENNTTIFITSMNSFGSSPETKFLLPFTDIIYLNQETDGSIAVKNHLSDIKRTRSDFGEKPRWILFYRNISFQEVQDDFNFLTSENTYSQNGHISSEEKFRNQEFYGEIFQNDALVMDHQFDTFNPEDDFGSDENGYYYMKYSIDGWIFQEPGEIDFIEEFKDAISIEYSNYLSKKGLTFEDNIILKFILTHPDRNQDSIIIYLMEGIRWQL